MKAFLMLYVRDFDGDDDICPIKPGKSPASQQSAATLLASVCSQWKHIVRGWSKLSAGQTLQHTVKKLVEGECVCLLTSVKLIHCS